jgi:hypothetical protein
MLFVVLIACVSTQTTGVRSAALTPGVQFSGVLVSVRISDLAQRQHYEQALVAELAGRHIRAQSWVALFPPVDQYSNEQIVAVASQNKLDTLLEVQVAGERHEAVATGETTNCTASGNNLNCNSYQTGQMQHGLGVIFKLYNLSDGKVLWYAQSKGEGHGAGIFGRMGVGSDIIEHMAGDVGDQIGSLYAQGR